VILFLNCQTSDLLSNPEIVDLTKFYNIVFKDGRGLEEVSVHPSIADSELGSPIEYTTFNYGL